LQRVKACGHHAGHLSHKSNRELDSNGWRWIGESEGQGALHTLHHCFLPSENRRRSDHHVSRLSLLRLPRTPGPRGLSGCECEQVMFFSCFFVDPRAVRTHVRVGADAAARNGRNASMRSHTLPLPLPSGCAAHPMWRPTRSCMACHAPSVSGLGLGAAALVWVRCCSASTTQHRLPLLLCCLQAP
jgi:hypothetical protein